MGVDPYFQGTPFETRVRCLTGFGGLVRVGYYGRGKQVQSGTVSGALTAIGKTIALATGINPLKIQHSEKFLPRISEMLEGFSKLDPATVKKLPIEVDIPNRLAEKGYSHGANELSKAVGDLAIIAFYYLLRVGEYTSKATRNNTKQTKQFKLEDITFFKRVNGRLRQLSRKNASDEDIMSADSCTLKIDNQKNGWRGVCVNQHATGDPFFCGVRALGRRFCTIRNMTSSMKTFLSAYWVDGKRCDVTDNNMRDALKIAATELDYPCRGIPIDRIDTHSLRAGGATALHLAGYNDRHIMKMGRWRSATFMEYIHEELDIFAEGMAKDMAKTLHFVNVSGGAFTDITSTVMTMEYETNVSAPAAASA